MQLADAAGTIVWQYNYDAFGNEKSIAGQDPANDSNPFRYCGEYFDVETKTIYLRNRSYSPGTGRFTSEDPIRDGLNWYTYCGGNPIIFVDPLGLSWKSAAISSKDGFVVYFTSQWDAITHPIQTLKTVWQEANSPKSYEEIFYMSLGPTFGSDARYIKVGVEAVISGDFDQFAYATGQKGAMIAEMIAIAGVSKGIGKVGDKIKAAKGAGSKQFNGKTITQDNGLFNPDAVDAKGRTNIQRMEKGLAPIGYDGKSVNIHHIDQTNTGPVTEISGSSHTQNYSDLHTNTGQLPSQIDRNVFNQWRTDYWKWRANDFK